jgi:hypothetical protein
LPQINVNEKAKFILAFFAKNFACFALKNNLTAKSAKSEDAKKRKEVLANLLWSFRI